MSLNAMLIILMILTIIWPKMMLAFGIIGVIALAGLAGCTELRDTSIGKLLRDAREFNVRNKRY